MEIQIPMFTSQQEKLLFSLHKSWLEVARKGRAKAQQGKFQRWPVESKCEAKVFSRSSETISRNVIAHTVLHVFNSFHGANHSKISFTSIELILSNPKHQFRLGTPCP